MTINGGIPGPTLHLREGEDATITVTNDTDERTSVHWHGLMLPGMMDGVPGFNGFMGIEPGASYTYTFRIRQSGTYWYHSHSGTQDQTVLGAIVIDPAKPAPSGADRDYVVLLGDAGEQGLGTTLKDRLDWGAMRMDPTDLADVTGYSFLVNGKAPDRNETFIFRKGERIRLRLINGSAMTLFDVRIPGLKMTVVAADGNDVDPVPVDEIRMGVAERYDVLVEPKEDMPYTLFAESIDRIGYARATLATADGQEGPIPERRPRALLSMADMGMAHDGGDMASMDHSTMDQSTMDHSTMDHSAMGHAAANGRAEGEEAGPRPVGWASGFPPEAKVLAYSDLRSPRMREDNSEPVRTIEMRLTGNMERYVWTLNGDR
jgi:FtsP/CotA-like multicopper oxidase with cupredoxin domain